GTPRPPPFRPVLWALRDALRDPLLAVLALALAGAFGYVAALVIGTAPNDYDALWYHLARAAFWKQQHAVAYISGANDARLNGFVFGSFLACCAYFLFSGARVGFALVALALGLAIGTKITALLALPVLALVGAFLYPRRRWRSLVLVGAAGVALGSYWYLFN